MKFFVLALFIFLGFTTYAESQVDTTSIEARYELGIAELENNNFDEALTNFNSGLSLSKSLDNNELIAHGHLNLSKYYLEQNQYLESIESVNKAISIFESLYNTLELSNSIYQLGTIHGRISNFDEALTYYFKALRLKEQLNDDVGVAVILNKIGNVYLYVPKLDKAEENYRRALELNLKHDNYLGITFNSINLGVIHQKKGEYDEAIAQFRSVLEKKDEYNIPKIEQAVIYGNIGSTLTAQKKYEESLQNLTKALELKLEVKNYGRAAHTCNDISEAYIEMKQFNNAKKFALKAIDYSENVNLFQKRLGYQLLSESENELGNYKSSYAYLKEYNKLKDSILSIDNLKNINENQIKYESEKRDLKIRAQESDIALLNAQNKVKNQYMVFGAVGLISLFSFIILVRSRNREKQKQLLQSQFSRDLLQSQEKERTRIAKDLHDSVGQQLTLIKRKSQKADQDEISQLTNNALEDVRSISRGLYPAILQQFGLTESIEQLILEFDESTDIFFSSEIATIDEFLNEEESLNFYRFIQEGLSNAIKHSEAKAVSINMEVDKHQISVTITDNGKGFDATNMSIKNSLGLKTLSERIQILNGQFKIESHLNKGTTITVLIPIK